MADDATAPAAVAVGISLRKFTRTAPNARVSRPRKREYMHEYYRRRREEILFERKNSFRVKLRALHNNAARRGLAVCITGERAYELFASSCHYCGEVPRESAWSGIDRRDNDQGYTLENSVACCFRCNFMKSKTPADAFVAQACKIADFRARIPD